MNTIRNQQIKHFIHHWKSLIMFDSIRFHKILEMVYYSVIYWFLGIITGQMIDGSIFPEDDKESVKNYSTFHLGIHVLSQLIVTVISIYYIHKIGKTIPFLWWFNPNYQPGRSVAGQDVFVVGLFFASYFIIGVQTKFQIRSLELYRRFFSRR